MMPRVVSSTVIAMLVVARAKEPSRLATDVEGTRHKEIAADMRRQVRAADVEVKVMPFTYAICRSAWALRPPFGSGNEDR